MKKLILHIGSPKTGTSSIQRFLEINREKIRQQGFTYPGSERNHHKLWFMTDGTKKDMPRQFNLMEESQLIRALGTYLKGFEQDIIEGNDTQIISTEYLFIQNQQYIENVINYLRKFSSEIRVILFVRNPVSYYKSVQQQMIKARSYIESPQNYRYQFRSVIEAWEQFTGVTVMEYVPGKNIVESFCEFAGLDLSTLHAANEKKNVSLSLEQMLLLEKIQKHIYPAKEDVFKPHLKTIEQIDVPFASKPELKPWVEWVIFKNHRNDINWLRDRFEVDFLAGNAIEPSKTKVPSFNSTHIQLSDIYKIRSKDSLDKFESIIMDALLKQLMQKAAQAAA